MQQCNYIGQLAPLYSKIIVFVAVCVCVAAAAAVADAAGWNLDVAQPVGSEVLGDLGCSRSPRHVKVRLQGQVTHRRRLMSDAQGEGARHHEQFEVAGSTA